MILKKQLTWIALALTLILGLGNTIFTPSMPSMQVVFDASTQDIQFSLVTYFGCYILGLIVLGPISDRFGRKGPLLFGLSICIGTSVCIAFSKTIGEFWLFRGIQGIGGSILGVCFRATLGDRFFGRNLSKALSYTSIGYRIGPIIGPVIGGVLQTHFGWNSTFFALALIAGFVFYLVLFHFKETHIEKIPIESLGHSWGKYRSVLKKPSFVGASICRGIQYGMLIIFSFYGPFVIINSFGYSPIFYGHIASGVAIVAIFGIFLNRFLLHVMNEMTLIRIGIICNLLIALIQIACAWYLPKSLQLFVLPIGAFLFFWGFVSSNMSSHAINLISKGKGVAASLQDFLTISTTLVVTGFSILLPLDSYFPLALYLGGLVLSVFSIYKWLFLKEEPQS